MWKSGNDLQEAQRRATELQVENAKADAATANENTEALKKENLKLAIQLEQEQQERLKLARRVGPRIITPEEKKFIVSALRSYPNQKITVNLLASHDPEAKSFSEQLINTLKEAGWNVIRGNEGFPISPSPPFYGVYCRVFQRPSPSVRAFISMLTKLDIDHEVQHLEPARIGDAYLDITIGLKRAYDPTPATKKSAK